MRRRSRLEERIQASIAGQRAELVRHGAVVRVEADPEGIHKMRVAIRRARAVLHAARPILDRGWSDALRDELSWLAEHLAPARDADVLHAHVMAEVASLGTPDAVGGRALLAVLEDRRHSSREGLREAVSGERFAHLLAAMSPAAMQTRLGDRDVTVKRFAERELRAVRKHHRRMADPPGDAELHRLRIIVKRSRYAAELLDLRKKRVARFLDRAIALQDVLGEHQDAVVAEAVIREAAAAQDDVQAWLVAGRLIERERRRRKRMRKKLPATWRRFERAGRAAIAR
jgi:CHAD domain-containing protein